MRGSITGRVIIAIFAILLALILGIAIHPLLFLILIIAILVFIPFG